MGKKGGIEQRICENLSIPFRSVPVEGWPRRRSPRKAWVAAKLAYSVARCFLYLMKFRPQAVLGVGGYVSLPLGLAAQRMGIPTVLHEQNRLLGMANRMLAQKAERILLSYPETVGEYPKERAVLVGNPVRAGFITPPSQEEARERLDLDPEIPVVLVCGGSQGARTLNEAVKSLLPELREGEIQVLWMTGKADAAGAREAAQAAGARVEVFSFIEDMPAACAASDLIVSRSGASTTAEIACLGKPSVLVPYPHAAENHQEQNARAFEERGAAVVVLDEECSGQHLLSILRRLLSDGEELTSMGRAAGSLAKPAAGEAIVGEIFGHLFESASA